MAYHRAHHHIEYGRHQWVPLCHSSLSVEGFSVVFSCPLHHLKPLPISAEESEVPRPHAISLQDVQAPVPVQCTVCLVQVQEDCVDYRLPHGRNLMEQLDIEGGGPRTATCSESIEGVVEFNGGGEAAI